MINSHFNASTFEEHRRFFDAYSEQSLKKYLQQILNQIVILIESFFTTWKWWKTSSMSKISFIIGPKIRKSNQRSFKSKYKNKGLPVIHDKRGKWVRPFVRTRTIRIIDQIYFFHPQISHYSFVYAPHRKYFDTLITLPFLYKDFYYTTEKISY